MQTMLSIFAYNRPIILEQCLSSVLAKAGMKFDLVVLYNDGGGPQVTKVVNGFYDKWVESDEHVVLQGGETNKGYDKIREHNFDLVNDISPQYAFFVEQDYVFRNGWALDVMSVLENGNKPLAVAGYSHPDFYNEQKTMRFYVNIARQHLGHDLENREHFFKPYQLDTPARSITVQGTSNACGTFYCNWEIFKILMDLIGYEHFMKSFIEPGHGMNDGILWALLNDAWWKVYGKFVNPEYDFCLLDICDYSVANCFNGGETISYNGGIPEGKSNITSPRWIPEVDYESICSNV